MIKLRFPLLAALVLAMLAPAQNSSAEERKWALVFNDGIVAHWEGVYIFKEDNKVCKTSDAQMCICLQTLEDAIYGSISDIPPIKLRFHPESPPDADVVKESRCGGDGESSVANTFMEQAFELSKSKFEMNKIIMKIQNQAVAECSEDIKRQFKNPQIAVSGSNITDYSDGLITFLIELKVQGAIEKGIADCQVSYDLSIEEAG